MRRLLAGLLAAALAGPALGEDRVEQFKAAREVFLGPAPLKDRTARIVRVLVDLDGAWIPASPLFDGGPAEAGPLADYCARAARRVERVSPFAFEMRWTDRGNKLVQRFTARGEHRFAASMDDLAYLKALGADRPGMENFALGLLGDISFDAAIFRPSADVLVIVPEGRPAMIWLRC